REGGGRHHQGKGSRRQRCESPMLPEVIRRHALPSRSNYCQPVAGANRYACTRKKMAERGIPLDSRHSGPAALSPGSRITLTIPAGRIGSKSVNVCALWGKGRYRGLTEHEAETPAAGDAGG